MKRTLFTLLLLFIANAAFGYEFHLQFTPPAGGRILKVAGYQFAGNTVAGNCSYDTVSACSGRGCHSITTYYYGTCTWDWYGNLLSRTATSSAPTAPNPLYTTGTEIVYAALSTTEYTGFDTRGFGFVQTPAAHYTWQTPNGSYAVIPDAPYSISATLTSDGDLPLDVTAATVTPQIFGTVTPSAGSAAITGNTCGSSMPSGSTCTLTVSYNPTTISCTYSPYGYAYTGIDLSLGSNAPLTTDFTERFTVTGVPICGD